VPLVSPTPGSPSSVTTTQSPTPSKKYTKHVDRDVWGNDFECKQDGSSADVCKAKCDAEPACKGYNYLAPGSAWGDKSGCCYKRVNGPLGYQPGTDFYTLDGSAPATQLFNGETYTFQNPFKVRMNAPSGPWMCVNGDGNNLGERRLNVWPNTAGTAGHWQIYQVPGQPANVFMIRNVLRSDPKFTSGGWLCVNGDAGSTKADYGVNLWPNTAGEAGLWIIEQVPGQPAGTYSCKNLFKVNQQAEAPFLAVNGNPGDLGNPWVSLWRDAGGDPCWWTIAKV
jgi:hypothetical protein